MIGPLFWLLLTRSAGAAPDTLDAPQYAKEVAKTTEEMRIYDGWYTALLVRGTLVTDELRVVQDARIAAITGANQANSSFEGVEVVLAASTQFRKELKLAANGSTPWTIQLRAGEMACAAPQSIDEVKKPSPLEKALYPHLTQWDTLIRLSYGSDACAGATITALDFHSARGHGSIRWAH